MSSETYRVGRRAGQDCWQIKKGAGSWRVVHECDSLQEAAAWITAQGVDIATIHVADGWPRRSLAEHIGTPVDRSDGWGSLLNVRDAHYFRDGRSLCNRWACFGSPIWERNQTLGTRPRRNSGTCVTCWKKREKEEAANTTAESRAAPARTVGPDVRCDSCTHCGQSNGAEVRCRYPRERPPAVVDMTSMSGWTLASAAGVCSKYSPNKGGQP